MNWKYTVIGSEVRIDQVEEPEALVVIPEELDGLPVVELGAYVLAHSHVEEIHLPSRLRRIGAYGFYNCENLRRIYCYGRVLDLGTGLFADVANVEFLDITLFEGEKSCFQEMLSELRQTLRVRVHMPDGREARLIFPEYYEEAIENTPARILSIETHGCGHRYRYCFVKREFQFHGYDEVFQHVKVQEPESLVTELAIGRLRYPMGLQERYRIMYENYVKEHWKMAGRLLIEADGLRMSQVTNLESGGIGWLAELLLADDCRSLGVPGSAVQPAEPPEARASAVQALKVQEPTARQQVAELIDMAQQAANLEAVSWLMDFWHRKFGKVFNMSAAEEMIQETAPAARKRKRKFEL